MKKVALSLVGLTALIAAACGPVQSEECAKYVDCQAHYDATFELSETDLSGSYGPEGSCWSSNQEAADACTTACENAVSSLADGLTTAEEDLGACG